MTNPVCATGHHLMIVPAEETGSPLSFRRMRLDEPSPGGRVERQEQHALHQHKRQQVHQLEPAVFEHGIVRTGMRFIRKLPIIGESRVDRPNTAANRLS